jgi:hypothetical protein
LAEDASLLEATSVTITATNSESVTSLELTLDGSPMEISVAPPWTVDLEPMTIAPGSHTLSVTIRYDDEDQVSAVLNFMGPPGWLSDIEPIFVARCAQCHGNRPDARSLETRMSWIDDFDLIVFDVESGRMPLGMDALTPEQVQTVKGWGAAGYPE